MAGKRIGSLLLIVAGLAVLQISSAQTIHIVGDSTGWGIPPSTSFYSGWASSHTFKVGDILEFNFVTGEHTVAEVTKSAYDACSTGSTISLTKSGPANLTLSSAGTHYYICTITGHCSLGQKLAITATAPTPAPPTPSKTPAPSPQVPTPPTPSVPSPPSPAGGPSSTHPPPPSAAPAGAVASMFFSFFSIIVVAFLY